MVNSHSLYLFLKEIKEKKQKEKETAREKSRIRGGDSSASEARL